MKYKNYLIFRNEFQTKSTNPYNFLFVLDSNKAAKVYNGESLEDCKSQIDELIEKES